MRESLFDYCVRTRNMTLLRQWDETYNGELTPRGVSYGSKQKVWWRCDSGHLWQAHICSRTGRGTGCPVCARRVPLPGQTDLATLAPELAAQWDPIRNGSLQPQQVLPGSHRLAWWCCGKGHVWQARISSRTAGCGCPVCAGRKILETENDLLVNYPEVARQWHPEKNRPLQPGEVASGSRKKVWWICDKGHEWYAAIASRTSGGSGCPVCAGRRVVPGENDLASRFPTLAKEWHPAKNGIMTPMQVTSLSNRKVWWRCSLGHEFYAAVSARVTSGSACPYCSGQRVLPGFNDLATRAPQTAAQWHPELNGLLTPEMVMPGSHRKVWWKCSQGHVWKAVIYSRTGSRSSGCPICAGRTGRRRLEAKATEVRAQ